MSLHGGMRLILKLEWTTFQGHQSTLSYRGSGNVESSCRYGPRARRFRAEWGRAVA
jgi:hypothetical protein